MRIVQESRLTQTSPRVDVDEAPGAELLYTTELVATHDPIKLLIFDDNLGLHKETLPISSLRQILDSERRSCPRGTYLAQPIAGLTSRQFEIHVLQCRKRNFPEL